jgi:hypothetical protein
METNTKDQESRTFWFLIIGAIITMAYCFCVTFMFIPKANERLADVILGVLLGSTIKDAYSYFTSSTQSSKNKDATVKDANSALIEAVKNSTPIIPAPEIKN